MRPLIAIVALFAVGSVWADEGSSPAARATNGSCSFREVYKGDGWQLPGLAGAVPDGGPEGRGVVDPYVPGVVVKRMKPGKADGLLVTIGCDNEGIGRLVYSAMPVSVMEMWRYEFGGMVFAYSIVYEPYEVFQGKRRPIPAYDPVALYDIDGSGVFRIMRHEEPGRMVLNVEVPQWVKARAESHDH